MSKHPSQPPSLFASGFIGLVVGAILGAASSLVVSVIAGFSGMGWDRQVNVMIFVAVVFVALSTLIGLIAGYSEYDSWSAKERELQEEKRKSDERVEQERLESQQRWRDQQIDDVRRTVESALTWYRSAVHRLNNAGHAVQAAEDNWSRRAFTPFWESTEAGYVSLADHKACLDELRTLAVEYPAKMAAVAENSAERLPELPAFPIEARLLAESGVSSKLVARLYATTCAAQSDYEFASIFEQRRTTAAVIAGFGSLGDAITDMERAVRSSTYAMSDSLESVRTETERVAFSLNSPHVPNTMSAEAREISSSLKVLAARFV